MKGMGSDWLFSVTGSWVAHLAMKLVNCTTPIVCCGVRVRSAVPKAGTSGNGYAWEFQSYNQRDSDSKCFALMVAGVLLFILYLYSCCHVPFTHTMESLETTVLFVWNAMKLMEVRSLEIHQLGFGHRIGSTYLVSYYEIYPSKNYTIPFCLSCSKEACFFARLRFHFCWWDLCALGACPACFSFCFNGRQNHGILTNIKVADECPFPSSVVS